MEIACYYMPDFPIACERERRPETRGAPLALVGDGGLLLAVSQEAARAGVRPGRTVSSARMFCPDLVALPYERDVYCRMAEPLWDRLACDSSFVEPLAPEECLAAFSGAGVRERIAETAADLRSLAGVAVRTAVSLSRFTARMAARQGREEGVVVIEAGKERNVVAGVPMEALPFLQKEEVDRLRRLGLAMLGDVLAVPEDELQRIFRNRAFLLRRFAAGQDRDPVQALWPPDSEEHAINLDSPLLDEGMLQEALRRCAEAVARKLQGGSKRCRSTTLILRSESGRTYARTEILTTPENDPEALFQAAKRLLGRLRAHGAERFEPPVGIALRALTAERSEGVHAALFDERNLTSCLPHERQTRLEAVRERLERRFGRGAVRPAESMRRAMACHLWTYPLTRRLDEPIRVCTDSRGFPTRYERRGSWQPVARVHNRWSEAVWRHGRMEEGMVFRVETPALGFAEIRRSGDEWRLTAVAD